MAEKQPRPPYTTQSDLDQLFKRMATMQDPKQISTKWVKDYNLAATQPAAVVSVLKWLGVFDDDGKSLGVWNDLRIESKREATLRGLMEKAYSAIFDRVEIAKADRQHLKGAFIDAYASGDPGRPIKCFLTLCDYAGIEAAAAEDSRKSPSRDTGNAKSGKSSGASASPKPKPSTKTPTAKEPAPAAPGGIAVTLNVEIPADWSEEQIRKRVTLIRDVIRGQ